jgi:glycerol uptake facilitator-like aquaporin
VATIKKDTMHVPRRLKQYAAQCLAELFGTFWLVLLGDLAVAQAKFSKSLVPDVLGPNLSFATGVYVALMVAGPISG